MICYLQNLMLRSIGIRNSIIIIGKVTYCQIITSRISHSHAVHMRSKPNNASSSRHQRGHQSEQLMTVLRMRVEIYKTRSVIRAKFKLYTPLNEKFKYSLLYIGSLSLINIIMSCRSFKRRGKRFSRHCQCGP